MITYKDYMSDSSNLHHAYYSQFITDQTKAFILSSLKPSDINLALEAGDIHLNNIKIPFNHMGRGGGWWWDDAPFNDSLMRKTGATNVNSPSCHTCVAKAAAKEISKEYLLKLNQ